MAEATWYYSHGDKQLGPVSATELKQLAASGKLAPSDLVWKEGMDDWVAASTIDGLIPIAPPQTGTPPADPPLEPPAPDSAAAPSISAQPRLPTPSTSGRPGPRRSAGATDLAGLLGYARLVAYPALVVGLLLAMMSRGCDQLSSRGIQAADAQAKLARQQFDSRWKQKRQALEDEREAASEEGLPDRVTEISEELAVLAKDQAKEEKELTRGKWQNLQEDADTAQYKHAIGAWWRELCFGFGTIILTLGLLGVGLSGKGAERWVCLVILVIVIMNLYGSTLTFGLGGR